MSSGNKELFGAPQEWRILGVNRALLALQSGGIVTGSPFQEMVRGRLRERTPNFTTLANWLHASPSTIQKTLRANGTALCLDWLDRVTSFYQMSVSEMCAMPGSLWQEIKPLESQLLAIFREMTELERRSLLDVLVRRPAPLKRRAKLGHAELTDEQQLLVDLYVESDPQAREGVLKVLRGTAKHARQARHATAETTE